MSSLPRGAHDLTHKALRPFDTAVSMPDAPWLNIDLVVPYGHGHKCPQIDD
jgi:hypothetical protein